MKGIILAGGSGTRLHPLTNVMSKQLLPVYDKPMIYYPLSTLMLAGISEVMIISTPQDLPHFKKILGDGADLGMNFFYAEQKEPNGIAEAFIIGEEFIAGDDVCLVLGDNIFYGNKFTDILRNAKSIVKDKKEACVFGYYVNDPERYGVVEFSENKKALSIEEKPNEPKSNYAVVGLYFYPGNVVQYAKNLNPSARGELEITDINKIYLKAEKLQVQLLGRGFAWLDTGTHESLAEATQFVMTIEKRQGLKVSCIEEIAYLMGFIDKKSLLKLAEKTGKSTYGQYLKKIYDK